MAKSGMAQSDVESDDEESPVPEECSKGYTCDDSVCVITNPVKTSTSISILIESLVKNLCYLYEPDQENATRTYHFICEKLCNMKLIDESYNMNEFEGMRNQYQRALHQLLKAAIGGDHVTPICPVWPNVDVTNEWSHYHREFDEIEYIAGGGFGKVYRVKHRLDGTEYAVKKIFIRAEGITSVRNYLSEVKTFASLNHSNIVQYKAAWLELGADCTNGFITEHSSDSDFANEADSESPVKGNIQAKANGGKYDTYIFNTMISEVESSFQEGRKEESSDFEINFENSVQMYHHSCSSRLSRRKRRREKRHSISEGGNAICTIEEIQNIKMQQKTQPRWATLYIQMTLCQTTLKQWLENRNQSEAAAENRGAIVPVSGDHRTKTITEIMKQLLQGLEYIHSKNIVHHDIKPSNIFLQVDNGSLLVQLGDFGLACPLQSARHTLALGTKLYAAPEQLKGFCNRKSDMYSLGIVVLELAESFQTDMERVQSISHLRKGQIPEQFAIQQPQLVAIIRQLVVNNPNNRPDAVSLLKRLTVDVAESEVVQNLRCQIAEKDQEILRLRAMLENAGVPDQ